MIARSPGFRLSPMGTLLAFDTSTDAMGIALVAPGWQAAHDRAGGAQASATLVPELMALLAAHGLALAGVDAIAFGCGPGAFTGLRTACSVAQGLAFGASKPVIPVDSLLLVADDARAQTGATEVCVAMDARMDEIYAGGYRWADGRWTATDAPALLRLDAFQALQRARPGAVVAGSALDAFGERLALSASVQRVPQPRSRAEALARVAAQLWSQGVRVDAAHALPVYLRDKVAQTTVERAHDKAMKAKAVA
ncbi:tRNA threonylcarbamoyladenosine biosynthesis protein TsaB [Rhizobacter sp. SG703]|nr:tRNA threonylcarbamoyladenosine biosynthesis protein TsaB [Rhizobacter sp. SG703]